MAQDYADLRDDALQRITSLAGQFIRRTLVECVTSDKSNSCHSINFDIL
jgi:chemotaxis regulatin CheY-phosphate phosphatase CheZ